jgi:hypothetical protein
MPSPLHATLVFDPEHVDVQGYVLRATPEGGVMLMTTTPWVRPKHGSAAPPDQSITLPFATEPTASGRGRRLIAGVSR